MKQPLALMAAGRFAEAASAMQLRTIHITEKDTQVSTRPRRPNEYINTWSVSGFAEEVCAPAELGWGTHEQQRLVPFGGKSALSAAARQDDMLAHPTGEKNQVCGRTRGCNTLINSWTALGPFTGMLVRHGEAYSISSRLTVNAQTQGKSYLHALTRHTDCKTAAAYRPSVYFVYLPSDAGQATLHRLRERDYALPEAGHMRTMFGDIVDGKDEIGCLLMGPKFGAWWIGSSLDIHEARLLAGGMSPAHRRDYWAWLAAGGPVTQRESKTLCDTSIATLPPGIVIPNDINPTTLQVAGSLTSAILYALKHPTIGLCFADDIDFAAYSDIADLVMGPITSCPVPAAKWPRLRDISAADFQLGAYRADLTLY
jgi:homospermidine synthase